MALVSRVAMLGQSPVVQSVQHAIQGVVAQARPNGDSLPDLADERVAVFAGTETDAVPAGDLAATAPTLPAGHVAVAAAFLLVALGGFLAYAMPQTTPFHVSSAMAAYGGLLVFASAIERILEPVSHRLPGRHATNLYEQAVVDLSNGVPTASLTSVAHAKAKADRAVADRAIIMWGLATAVATVVAAASGFYLLRMIASPSWHPSIPTWVDALVTGVVVGSGTKPLHDLITKAQTSRGTAV
jgi:hypothetical protein